jgi:hypothetical protein
MKVVVVALAARATRVRRPTAAPEGTPVLEVRGLAREGEFEPVPATTLMPWRAILPRSMSIVMYG